ncbi:MAG: hypothetical protein B0D96_09835 [Candidatus Sedimenticola endophacoides]|uniref:Uncharacterized protein n=1 Tax=Candidatus Sedimenticola endophacoides TaxID=2548426 RepID=A0A657PVQ3_9GAMM|nr:MAG: hypothetical protein B0D94_01995 [Candidatus Sedimenticola endophacoides]OQX34230.1 MAG: hypothetical protein B0D96_09835 [Candidatus Sedimenticola endophacoides]OQX41563.1 MAG: hypothetical protein B0D82_02225 [Candidatus Sedimenticola endophacoides]OQX42119.1 MAG: hypothetical protein B0D89_02015 [Candidatus Sedimenticola endophacoides]OQX43316.1 MAG: hypothetical protein B0D88_04710 [Candidatus Sedimenticola endophacoides]
MRIITPWLALAALLCLPVQATTQDNPDRFQGLLEEAGLTFQTPDGFSDIELKRYPTLQHERALRHADGKVEVRYAIRPLGRLEVDYNDAHSSTPEPNHLFSMMFHTLSINLAKGTHIPSNEYPKDRAKEKFQADWASAAVFDVRPEFGEPFKQALLLAIHRNDLADAYVVVLFDDYKAQKPAIRAALASLAFKP